MDQSLAPVSQSSPLSLDPKIKQHLTAMEDFVNYYVLLEEASNSVSWIKADLLSHFVDKFGWEAINGFAGTVNVKGGTIKNYIRVAKAFPPDKRLPNVSFSIHYQASFADSYDGEGNFDGEKRFDWTEKAADEGYSTRRLKDEIDHEKEKDRLGVDVVPCYFCGRTDGEILRCVLYIFGRNTESDRLELHEECKQKVLAFAKQHYDNVLPI